jgi:RimJ/RimL family protein N-acetyltransferase
MEDSEPEKRYSVDDVFTMIHNPSNSVYLMMRHQNALVGYVSIYDFKPEGEAEFSFMIGNPEFRGRNLGKLLVQLLCDKAKSLGLKKLICSVGSNNEPSIRCIQKNGFSSLSQSQDNEPSLNFAEKMDCSEFFFEKHL